MDFGDWLVVRDVGSDGNPLLDVTQCIKVDKFPYVLSSSVGVAFIKSRLVRELESLKDEMQAVVERMCGPREDRTRSATVFERSMRCVAPSKRCYPFGVQLQKPTQIHNPCAEFKYVDEDDELTINQRLSNELLLVCLLFKPVCLYG